MAALAVALAAILGNSAAQDVLSCRSGQDAIARGAFSTALSHLTRCLENEGLSMRSVAAALHLRAMAHASTGEPLKAAGDYRRSLGIRPPEIAWDLIPLGIYLRRALSHDAMGERDKARTDLAKAIEIGRERGLDPASAPDEYRAKFVEYGLIPEK